MADIHCRKHENHDHQHGEGCGHVAIKQGLRTAYVHDGHLHLEHDGHVDDTVLEVTTLNPQDCTPDHECQAHDGEHKHGPGCGHESLPHGDHTDYVVDGHLHHPHDGHCDFHGKLSLG